MIYLLINNYSKIGPKQKKQTKSLARALVQARNAMDLTLAQRIQKFSFNILYKGQIGSETGKGRDLFVDYTNVDGTSLTLSE